MLMREREASQLQFDLTRGAGCRHVLVSAARVLRGRQGAGCAQDIQQGVCIKRLSRVCVFDVPLHRVHSMCYHPCYHALLMFHSQVDVWSVGIMFYQMLFGARGGARPTRYNV